MAADNAASRVPPGREEHGGQFRGSSRTHSIQPENLHSNYRPPEITLARGGAR
ncbi:MAG: hypothetical protein HZA93_05805 [Verrucomicrobia bacterium]|nr:hypothetical protein [Verrucomicrobiota bacterium]